MQTFRQLKRVMVSEQNSLLPLPPTTPPFSSPFPIQLTSGGTIDPLAIIRFNIKHRQNSVLLSGVINWSATFTPPATPSALNVPGFVDVTFEILRDGIVLYTVTQTAVQKGAPVNQEFLFTTAVPTFELAALLHLDNRTLSSICDNSREFIYTLRATNVLLAAPQVDAGVATVTAAVGGVTLVAQEFAAC